MEAGSLIAGRFELRAHASTGGMGIVHRALDRRSGEEVALKTVRGRDPEAARRFLREASLLAELRDPHIVRHVAHGETDDGALYLAMEWLDGVDLQQRLRQGPLDQAATIALARGVAAGLARAHGAGIVHRDLKPANLFLVGGDPSRVKILDFGVARAIDQTAITLAGGVVGTPGYMAPEQARGDGSIDARADLFSLGCVLYECVAGRPAFVARDALALLFKILVDEPPALADVHPGVSPELAGLVGRLLVKDPAGRPDGAEAVSRALGEVPAATVAEPAAPLAAGLTAAEQRIVCIVLAKGGEHDPSAPTLQDSADHSHRTRIRAHAQRLGASVEWLAAGGMIAVLRGGAISAADQAALAGRFVLELHAEAPDVPLVIGTGRAELRGAVPVGPVVDRAVELLREVPASTRPAPILCDETSARLLELGFELDGARLLGRREAPAGSRRLLGKSSPCLGRDRELDHLRRLIDDCIDERESRAVLITGPAGIGKSRVVHELIEQVGRRVPAPEVWRAAGDPVTGRAPLGLLAPILRAMLSRLEAQDRQPDVVALTAELAAEGAGATTTPPGDPAARAAQIRRGVLAVLRATCARRPLVLVLDDLHWADDVSLRFVDDALDELDATPLLVVGMARPEIADLFPQLWRRRRLDQLSLGSLRRTAAAELLRGALGGALDEATLGRVIDRADGNPFYLEELARAVADGRGDELPETVLALATARLDVLEREARQLLRAGSVYGETFTRDEVAALLERADDADPWLPILVEREVLERVADPAGAFRFRHAYLRDAAYAMLTDADRHLGHRLAAEHLERAGGAEPAVLAEHLERAGDPRAAEHYLAAARQALRRSAPEAAIDLTRRGAARATGRILEDLQRVQAGAYLWRGDFAALDGLAATMIGAAAPGSKAWWTAAVHSVLAPLWLGRRGSFRRALARFVETAPAPDAFLAYGRALGALLPSLVHSSERATTELLHGRFVQGASPMAGKDRFVRAMLAWLDGYVVLFRDDDPWRSLALMRESGALFEEAGDVQRGLHMQGEGAMLLGDLGDLDAHESENRRVLVLTDHMGIGPMLSLGFLACNLAEAGRPGGVPALIDWVLARAADRSFAIGEGLARAAQATLWRHEGRLEDAEREAVHAVRLLVTTPRYQALAYAALVEARLAMGRAGAAMRAARAAMRGLERTGPIGPTEAAIRLVHARALAATGDPRAAAAIADARDRVLARAARAPDDAARDLYLTSTWPARTLAASRSAAAPDPRR